MLKVVSFGNIILNRNIRGVFQFFAWDFNPLHVPACEKLKCAPNIG
mgnify:CR=1